MKCTTATYSIKLNLGNYQSEDLSITYEPEPGEMVTGLDLLARAREDVLKSTTAAKRKEKNGEVEA